MWNYELTTSQPRRSYFLAWPLIPPSFPRLRQANTNYLIVVRAVWRDIEGTLYISDDSATYDKTSGQGAIIITTDSWLPCSGDTDSVEAAKGVIETDSNPGYCACYSGFAPDGDGVYDDATGVEACNEQV